MVGIREHVDFRSLWKTAGLLLALALLASPDAPTPVLFVYAVIAVVAVLYPIRAVGRTTILRIVGGLAIVAGAWVGVTEDVSAAYVVAFFVLGAVAVLLPHVYPDPSAGA